MALKPPFFLALCLTVHPSFPAPSRGAGRGEVCHTDLNFTPRSQGEHLNALCFAAFRVVSFQKRHAQLAQIAVKTAHAQALFLCQGCQISVGKVDVFPA